MFITKVYAATTEATAAAGLDYASLAWKLFIALNVLVITVLAASFVSKWVRRKITEKQGDKHQELAMLYGRIAFIVVIAVGVTIGLSAAGIPLQWFSGAIGLGLGLAMQGPVGNFVAGIVLLSNDKFNLGDFVILDDAKGTIVDIQSRVTTLRAIDGAQISIPNTDLLTKKVTCYTRNPVRRVDIQIGVGYGTNLKEACELIRQVINKNPAVEPEPEAVVLVASVADSAVILEARVWVESHAKWWLTQSELTREIFDALQAAKIDIPYPVQTLRVDAASSDLLANQPNLLGNLQKIEQQKAAAIFEKVPVEG
jgi:small conductance mechanosensitive channel